MAEDTMLNEAIDAIQQGKKARAKEILTRLIQADQRNANYWVWMSAAVATKKERIYALKTALRADADNAAAKRGLILLGELPPDESVTPFPLDHPRLWEEESLSDVKEKPEREAKRVVKNPALRLAGIILGAIAIIAFAVFGLTRRTASVRPATNTPGPSPTYTLTPTALNAKPVATQAFVGPTPLWALLDATYTPTPLYVNTPRSVQAQDYAYAVKAAFANEDWEALVSAMEQIALLEPESADPYYYMGEAYRFMGENSKALKAYDEAIRLNENLGPAYVGKARVLPYVGAAGSVGSMLDTAIEKDPFFAEAYLERAIYRIKKKKYEEALADLEEAKKLAPNSAQVYYQLARLYALQEEPKKALEAAQQAYELDRTVLDTYLLLGQLYEANGEIDKAVDVLETYTVYEDENVEALSILGGAYYAAKDYDAAIEFLSRVIDLDRRAGKAYLYRGLSYMAKEDGENAVNDLEKAHRYLPDSFEASISLAQAHTLIEHYGDCYLQVERTRPLVKTDLQEALIYYWRATCHEGRQDPDQASRDWERLLELTPEEDSKNIEEIEAMQGEAKEHLFELYTPTPTSTDEPPTATSTEKPPTATGTEAPRTPTRTPRPTRTPTPKSD